MTRARDLTTEALQGERVRLMRLVADDEATPAQERRYRTLTREVERRFPRIDAAMRRRLRATARALTRLGVVLCLALAVGCVTPPPPVPVVVQGCQLDEPPPPLPTLDWREGPDHGGCLTDADTLALAVWHRRVRSWTAQAWARCRAPEHAKRNLLAQ